jgi:hypothetical protein
MSKSATKEKWVPRARDYISEKQKWHVKAKSTKYHPLLAEEVLLKAEENSGKSDKDKINKEAPKPKPKKKASFDDPLSMLSAAEDPLQMFEEVAPLQKIAAAKAEEDKPFGSSSKSSKNKDFEDWPDKIPRILEKYTTNKTISITADFLEEKEDGGGGGVKEVDQAKNRLEQLEQDEASDEAKSQMTQKEYISHMEDQHRKLKEAWEKGERVVALKIAIQCAKLLGDTSVPAFYPSMYSLLTMVLDTFGDLVFQRIKSRGVDMGGQVSVLPNDFRSSDVANSARETCRNWFFKTACIRELMPRLYIDMTLIKSYRFLPETDYQEVSEAEHVDEHM